MSAVYIKSISLFTFSTVLCLHFSILEAFIIFLILGGENFIFRNYCICKKKSSWSQPLRSFGIYRIQFREENSMFWKNWKCQLTFEVFWEKNRETSSLLLRLRGSFVQTTEAECFVITAKNDTEPKSQINLRKLEKDSVSVIILTGEYPTSQIFLLFWVPNGHREFHGPITKNYTYEAKLHWKLQARGSASPIKNLLFWPYFTENNIQDNRSLDH